MLFLHLFIVWVLGDILCPDDYYGEKCDIHIPATARISGVFEDPDCMDELINIDGIIIDYTVPKSLVPVRLTDCYELLTDESREMLFDNVNTPTECSYHPTEEEDPLAVNFNHIYIRGVISPSRQKEFIEKRFPHPFPINVLTSNDDTLTVNIQLGWFDTSHVIHHLCARAKIPSTTAMTFVVSITALTMVSAAILFFIFLIKPCVAATVKEIFDEEETPGNNHSNTFNSSSTPNVGTTDEETNSSSEYMDEIDMTEEELHGKELDRIAESYDREIKELDELEKQSKQLLADDIEVYDFNHSDNSNSQSENSRNSGKSRSVGGGSEIVDGDDLDEDLVDSTDEEDEEEFSS